MYTIHEIIHSLLIYANVKIDQHINPDIQYYLISIGIYYAQQNFQIDKN